MEPDHSDAVSVESGHTEDVLRGDSPADASPRPEQAGDDGTPLASRRRPSYDSYAYGEGDEYTDYELETGSMAGRSVAGQSYISRADSRLDRDLKDAINMVKVSDHKIGALRKMHAQYLLKRVEDALGGESLLGGGSTGGRTPQRNLDGDYSDASQSDDEGSSVADSAFVYQSQSGHKRSASGADFDRMSAQFEEKIGLMSDMKSMRGKGDSDSDEEKEAPEFVAGAFNEEDLDKAGIYDDEESLKSDEEEKWVKMFKRRVKINKQGCAIMAFFLVSFVFYMYIRITKTMDLGRYLAYGIYVLIVEVLGASATLLYGINLLLDPVPPHEYEDYTGVVPLIQQTEPH